MNASRRRRSIQLGIVICSLSSTLSHASSVLDVGTQYRMRRISLSKVDYGQSANQDHSYYSQRALAHIGAKFSPNIEFMTQFQAIGIAGSSTTLVDPAINPTGNRYPNTAFTPWIQSAYFKASQVYDLPMDMTIGRQPITLGDGLLLSDDDLGFTGIRLQSRLPVYGLVADLFTFRTGDTLQGNNSIDLYGIEVTKPTRQVRYQLLWLTEHDASGTTVYIRPSENPANTTKFPVGTNFTASRITRSFYDARVEARLLEGGFLRGEVAIQNGNVNRDPALGKLDLFGYGILLSGGLYTRTSKYGPIEIHSLFGLGSGDDGSANRDTSFHPAFGHRFDGLERGGFGEYFGASLYDAAPSSANPNGLPPGNSGIRVIGAGVTTHPTTLLSLGFDYFVYDAQENAPAAFTNARTESSLGSEFDFGIGFAYTNYLTFRASYALFAPGKAFPNRDQANRFLVEAQGRF